MHNNKKFIHISKNLFVSLAIRKLFFWFSKQCDLNMTQVKINAISILTLTDTLSYHLPSVELRIIIILLLGHDDIL
jgi:hypothetical protein